ncbi:phage minor head protein [Alkalicoccobacillus plakortidis]|uniref:Phage head morphogenesis protein n=1 Tax=Alkalicoccobacillus plakortidis TaxID=444060 RepID=A0ABT0XE44_9BACI|nr:phage minor head protein [Alkalicoccobacillus plakortidis]MCM2674085.1 phage head morphogenesis protein [Alkalicoccobacillus plakortidis]
MSKVDELIHSINSFIRKEADGENSLIDTLPDFEGKEKVEDMVENFETIIARLLRKQRKFILDSVKAFIAKDDAEVLENLLTYLREQIFIEDSFATELSQEAVEFFNLSVTDFASVIMGTIDQDIPLEVLSNRTVTWIEEWSEQLGELMKNTAHEAVEKILVNGISEGHGIAKIELELSKLPQFSRERARATAITEVLTASSVAQQESYSQSPAVTGKRWKHSGAKYSKPRENHMMLDGTVVGVDDYFVIPDSNELAQYPRDVSLSPKERINCHCTSGPEVDQAILGLSKEEKEEIRRQALADLGVI